MPMDNSSPSSYDLLFGQVPLDSSNLSPPGDDSEALWNALSSNNEPASVRNRLDISFSPLTSTNGHRRPHQRRRNRYSPSALANADQSSSIQAHHRNSEPFPNPTSEPLNPHGLEVNQYQQSPYHQQSRFDQFIQIPDINTVFPDITFTDRPNSRFSLDSTGGDSLLADSDFWPDLVDPASFNNAIDSNGFVDLTADSSPPHDMSTPRKRRQSATPLIPPRASPSRASKRRTTNDRSFKREEGDVEYLDLVDVDDDSRLSQVLDQQQAAAIDEQKAPRGDQPTKLSSLECRICLEPMTNITATHCGHLFCHYCIMESLIAGENQGEPGKAASKCPLCRKKVSRPKEKTKDKREVIPLEIKLCTRSSIAKGKEKA